MSKPVFSLISPAVRSGFYKRLYNSACYKNKVPFEVIFVGNEKPKKKIGDNFHYIYTNVKPAQCLEIAARNAQGDYLIPIADDLTFSKYFLNKVYSYINNKPCNVLSSFRISINGVMRDDWLYYHRPGKDKKRYAPMGISGAYDRKLWHEFGGIDQRFLYTFAETDMHFRFRETKELFITPDCWVDEGRDAHAVRKRVSKICSRKRERRVFDDFWLEEDGEISKYRLKEVISFDNKDILIKSQGRNLLKIWD